jgi:hypothetical protein
MFDEERTEDSTVSNARKAIEGGETYVWLEASLDRTKNTSIT